MRSKAGGLPLGTHREAVSQALAETRSWPIHRSGSTASGRSQLLGFAEATSVSLSARKTDFVQERVNARRVWPAGEALG